MSEENEMVSRADHWGRFVAGIEKALLPTSGKYPFQGFVDYKDWESRHLVLEKEPTRLVLFDVNACEAVRSWDTQPHTPDNPILDMFADVIVSWAAEHDGNPLSLVACLEGDLGVTAKGAENLWLHALGMDHDYRHEVEVTFGRFLFSTIAVERRLLARPRNA